jgi:hypothetical protein
MNSTLCYSCQSPKAKYACGICNKSVCKKCAQLLPDDSFSFLNEIPEPLTHASYCSQCFDEKVSEPLHKYNETMALAREVFVFYKTQNKETRSVRRIADPVRVEHCDDKDETLLRLAFLAAKANYNALVDVVISSQKIITDGYQKSDWQGIGNPVSIDPSSPLLLNKENH